ncbi:serine hydrolase domain-containing protein [Nocardia sp. IFM 10818]
MTFDTAHWQARLDALREENHMPGLSLAVLADGEIHELASGVLHRGIGNPVTTDAVFQVGSVTKIHTATLIMMLVDQGRLDLDAPVAEVLPDFRVADPEATKTITVRMLLNHTSGLSGDHHIDTGRGDDAVAEYVRSCADLRQDCPPGIVVSYCQSGYIILGRIIEVVTGQTYDAALREMLIEPLGLTHTVTLPEEVLRFPNAMSHLGQAGAQPEVAPAWNPLTRAQVPGGGGLCATAADIVRLAKLHLDGGVAPDGTRLLGEPIVAAMQQREIEVPDKWTVSSDAWGLGWTLYDWNGAFGYGHDGSAIGQHSYLRVAPEAGVIIVLHDNGGDTPFTHGHPIYHRLFSELLRDLAGIDMPEDFAPPAQPPRVDIAPYLGIYRRAGIKITIGDGPAGHTATYEFVDGMDGLAPPLHMELVPVTDTVFAGRANAAESWLPVVFSTLPDGSVYCYIGVRAAPKVA